MVNHPGGEESGSGVFGFFQSDLQSPFPVQLDLKKVALFGISLTTHFYPSPDPQQKYQPATEATPQESLGDRARSPSPTLYNTTIIIFTTIGRRNKTRVVALRDPATSDPLVRRHAAPKERSHTHAHTHAEPLQCGEAAFYQSHRRASERIDRRYHHGALSFLRTFFITCITDTSFFTID